MRDSLDEPPASLVVVGASLAGLRAVVAARAEGLAGRVVLVGKEVDLPYDRPPLSKSFLTGEVEDTTHPDSGRLADELDVDLQVGTEALSLDLEDRCVTTSRGAILFDRLLIATGSRPITPSFVGETPLVGVLTLRTKSDAIDLRRRLLPGARVVVVGAGFIGAEVASACRARGAEVTIIETSAVPLARAVGAMGPVLSRLHALHGVDLRLGRAVTEIRGSGTVRSVVLDDGTEIPADLVVVGVGARPATQWLESSGLTLHPADRGVVCDVNLATSAPGVWAAGDVAHWPDAHAHLVRLENWTNASLQGAHAARNAVRATPSPYATVPYYWTDWYGMKIQFVGNPEADEVGVVGDIDQGQLIALYRTADRVTGVLTVAEPGKVMKIRRLIDQPDSWDRVADLLDSWGYPAAFELSSNA